ncbi:MAG TPA: LysR family transcriptional regulator [Acidimicrobiales bacterium]|nr:LysR family transcriptional regulator [Acidimicrobiales bacterium]
MALPPRTPELTSRDLLSSVAETGSLGQAANRHGISQPAASLRIRSLERQLGVKLLERAPTGSRLTPAGTAVVDWAAPVLAGAQALVAGVEALRSEGHQLRVAASMTVAEYLMPNWLVALRRSRPDLSVALAVANSERVTAGVLEGAHELGFIEGPVAPAGLRHRTVGTDRLVVVAPPTHPWTRRRRPLSAPELASTPLVSRERGSGTREALEAAVASVGLELAAPVVELASTTAIKAAVAAGAGPAVLSLLAVASDLSAGRVVVVRTDERLALARPLRAVWSPDRPLDEGAAALVARAGRQATAPTGATPDGAE